MIPADDPRKDTPGPWKLDSFVAREVKGGTTVPRGGG